MTRLIPKRKRQNRSRIRECPRGSARSIRAAALVVGAEIDRSAVGADRNIPVAVRGFEMLTRFARGGSSIGIELHAIDLPALEAQQQRRSTPTRNRSACGIDIQ